ncbi:hypothetical protein Tco_0513410 [Tanacetum coccineum]
MIQPEPEDLPKDNPKLEIAVLSNDVLKLLFFDDATSFDSAVHRVHAVLDAAATVSAACIIAAGYIVSAVVPADYVSAGHVIVSADRDRIC